MIDLKEYKERALRILDPIRESEKDFLSESKRSNSRKYLPEYYLIFFLFSDLLGFKNLGRFDKIAWSFPVYYKEKAFLIEYRKSGVGIFIQDEKNDQEDALDLSKKIGKAVKCIRPFYDYIAKQAVSDSKFNVINYNQQFYKRFDYLLKLYKDKSRKLLSLKDISFSLSKPCEPKSSVSFDFERANWVAISCIEAFFSWTEHLFVHLAIIRQGLSKGEEVTELIEKAKWKEKFKSVIQIDSSKKGKYFFDELLDVRRKLRNYPAHGAFDKNGGNFKFHSVTGAVPVWINPKKERNKFSITGYLSLVEQDAIELIEEFIKFLWTGDTKPAMYYTQECGLPTILPIVSEGKYALACKSMKSMKEFTEAIQRSFDGATDMDWFI